MLELHYDRYGGPDVLRVAEVSERAPAAGQAKVRVRAVALNPLDWKIRAGHVRDVPWLWEPKTLPKADGAINWKYWRQLTCNCIRRTAAVRRTP